MMVIPETCHVHSGVWKYGKVLLVPGQVILKKLLVCTKSYWSCLFFKHSILANMVAAMLVHEFQGGLFLKVLPLDNQ